jgi:hypothetical protein
MLLVKWAECSIISALNKGYRFRCGPHNVWHSLAIALSAIRDSVMSIRFVRSF